MSWVAESNAASQKNASDHCSQPGPGRAKATPASAAPMTTCVPHVHARRVPRRSTNGDHSGLITHGR